MGMNEKKSKLMGWLELCERTVEDMKRDIVNSIGTENRVYTDEEDWMMERLDDATVGIKKAIFAIQRSSFKAGDEV